MFDKEIETQELVFKKAKLLINERKYEEAVYQLYLILNYHPNNEKALFESARIEIKLGNYEVAQKQLESLADFDNRLLSKLSTSV